MKHGIPDVEVSMSSDPEEEEEPSII